MGMYSIAIDDDCCRWQFKGGHDVMAEYEVGDKVPQIISTTEAGCGDFLDGVYDASEDDPSSPTMGWVIIKDGRIAFVVDMAKDHQAQLKAIFGASFYHAFWHDLITQAWDVAFDRSLWSDELWTEHDRQQALLDQEFAGWLAKTQNMTMAEYEALPPLEKMAIGCAETISKNLGKEGFSRQILTVKEP